MTARKEVCVRGWVGVWVRVWPLSEDKGTCARTHSNVLSGFHNVDYPGFFGGLGLAHIHTRARARARIPTYLADFIMLAIRASLAALALFAARSALIASAFFFFSAALAFFSARACS